jgi:hypothetical protein
MMQMYDPGRLLAFEQILARPLPLHLPPGGQARRFDGERDRRSTRLPGMIMAWLQYRHLETDAEEPLTARVRTCRRPRSAARLRNPRLTLLRRTASG